jgi:hypothetical protein
MRKPDIMNGVVIALCAPVAFSELGVLAQLRLLPRECAHPLFLVGVGIFGGLCCHAWPVLWDRYGHRGYYLGVVALLAISCIELRSIEMLMAMSHIPSLQIAIAYFAFFFWTVCIASMLSLGGPEPDPKVKKPLPVSQSRASDHPGRCLLFGNQHNAYSGGFPLWSSPWG